MNELKLLIAGLAMGFFISISFQPILINSSLDNEDQVRSGNRGADHIIIEEGLEGGFKPHQEYLEISCEKGD